MFDWSDNSLLASLEHSYNMLFKLTFANDRLISCTSITISKTESKASTIYRLINGIDGDEEVS